MDLFLYCIQYSFEIPINQFLQCAKDVKEGIEMVQYFTLVSKYNQENIPFHFDITGDCMTNHRIQEVKNFTLYESSGFVSVYTYFCDVFADAVRLLKSGKEIQVSIGVLVKIDGRDAILHLCKMSVDLPKEKLFLDNHHVHAVFQFTGEVQSIDNPSVYTEFLSDWIKEIRNSQSIEKQLKVEYFEDIQRSNLANISFYPYIKNQDKIWLLKEIIRATYHVGKVVDMSRFYLFTVAFKNIRGEDTLGYWWYVYKTIELDCRYDRDTIRSAFYHEYGHLLYDYAIVDNQLPPELKKKAKQLIHTIISILNNKDTLSDISEFEKGTFKKYLLTPTEIFARLFASYMIYEHDIKAPFEINHFNDFEVSTVTPLLKEFFKIIQMKENNHAYHCAACGEEHNIKFYAVVPHSEAFVQYDWFCLDCLDYSKDNIKELYEVKIDNISEENMNYLTDTR